MHPRPCTLTRGRYVEFLDFFAHAISGGSNKPGQSACTLQQTSADKLAASSVCKHKDTGLVNEEQCMRLLGAKMEAMFSEVRMAFR